MTALQLLLLFMGAFLLGIGATITLLASLGGNNGLGPPVRDPMEGCLTFVFGGMPLLLGCAFLIAAALA